MDVVLFLCCHTEICICYKCVCMCALVFMHYGQDDTEAHDSHNGQGDGVVVLVLGRNSGGKTSKWKNAFPHVTVAIISKGTVTILMTNPHFTCNTTNNKSNGIVPVLNKKVNTVDNMIMRNTSHSYHWLWRCIFQASLYE